MILSRHEVIDTFRKEMLEALDRAANRVIKEGAHGWVDYELKRFFKAVDAQAELVAARYNVTLIDDDPIE